MKVAKSCPTLCHPLDYTVHGILQAWLLEWVIFPFFRGSSQPRDRTQEDYLPAEPQGKPKNTGVGSLTLLQGIIPIQESNQDLLHCRWILYQLLYQGSPQVISIKWMYCYEHYQVLTEFLRLIFCRCTLDQKEERREPLIFTLVWKRVMPMCVN